MDKGRLNLKIDMKIALASYLFKDGDIDFNLSQIKKALSSAKGKADIVCFGESFLQGFDALSWNFDKDKDIAISQNSPVMQKICDLTLQFGVDLLLGYIERDEEALFSSCAVIQDGKIIHNYRRVSKGWKQFDITDFHYQEGNEIKPFFYRGKEFLLAICGDLWDFPERFKTKSPILWSVFVNYEGDYQEFLSEYAEQASKVANNVLMINSLSSNPESRDIHGGAFHFCAGKVKAQTENDTEDMLIVEI